MKLNNKIYRVVLIFFLFFIFILFLELLLKIIKSANIAELPAHHTINKINKINFNKKNNLYHYYISTCNFHPNAKNNYSKKAEEFKLYPLTNKSNTNIISSSEGEEFSEFLSDRYGFKNNDISWNEKKSNYFFGDSYGMSFHVSNNNSINNILEKKKIKILNLSGGCWGPVDYLIIKKELFNGLKKNIIPKPITLNLLYYTGNDYYHPILNYPDEIYSKYFLEDNFNQNIFEDDYQKKNNFIMEIAQEEIKISRFKFKQIFQQNFNLHRLKEIIREILSDDIEVNFYGEFVNDKNRSFNKIKKYIDLDFQMASKICYDYDCKVNVFILPEYKDFYYKGPKKRPGFYFEEYLKNLSRDYNFKYISIYDEFNKRKDIEITKIFPNQKVGHYSVNGYYHLSNIIFKNLK